ncbi:MAG: nucleoside hydrolase [Dongiaceae bacterium]
MKHRVIMDCDTGRDDAIAIALAIASPDEIDLIGITAVAGNTPLHLTERNARFVCELCGKTDARVYRGADRPLMRPLVTAEHAHGKTGIEGVAVRDPQLASGPGHAVDFVIEVLREAPDDTVTLVSTGPLTNVALLAIKAPQLLPKVKQIVLMGGARVAGGNVTPVSEFNIHVDPHAAKVVFNCGRPIVAFGLDVTYRVLAQPAHRQALLASRSSAARALAPIFTQMPGSNKERIGVDVVPMHDPCTIAWLIRPDLFRTKHVNVDVEVQGELTCGETVVDFWRATGRPPNTQWAHDVDGPAVLDFIVSRLSSLP